MGIFIQNIKWLLEKGTSQFYRRDKNLWVFGEWFGKRCCDNSLFLANYVAKYHLDIQVVWISESSTDLSLLSPKVKQIKIDTTEAKKILMHAGVAVYNQSLSDFSGNMSMYCMGAVTVNLWHGVPWKKIGIDAFSSDNRLKWIYVNYVLRLQRPKLFLSTSEEFTNILKSAYCVNKKSIIEAGYPRNSIFYDDNAMNNARKKVINMINNINYSSINSHTKIITYMPTFRDNSNNMFSFETLLDNHKLEGILKKHNAVIVQKAHFVNRDREVKGRREEEQLIFNINEISAAEVLAASDMLITDYSSCFFDYLLSDRPIIHYIYDYEHYANKDRGLYYDKEAVICGDAVEHVDELLKVIDENLGCPEKNAMLRQQRRTQFMMYESEDSCKSIFGAISEHLRYKD